MICFNYLLRVLSLFDSEHKIADVSSRPSSSRAKSSSVTPDSMRDSPLLGASHPSLLGKSNIAQSVDRRLAEMIDAEQKQVRVAIEKLRLECERYSQTIVTAF